MALIEDFDVEAATGGGIQYDFIKRHIALYKKFRFSCMKDGHVFM